MKVRDVMTSPAVTVGPDTPYVDLVHTMLANEVSGLPVVDQDGRLVGIVTEADLVAKEAYGYQRRRALGVLAEVLRGQRPQWVHKASARTAKDLMSADPVAVELDDSLESVARQMLAMTYKRFPVVRDGCVVGIVSRRDLLRRFDRSDAAITEDIRRILVDPLYLPETHQVHVSVVDGVVTLFGTVLWPSDIPVFEATIARIDGVVGVDNRLVAREREPHLS